MARRLIGRVGAGLVAAALATAPALADPPEVSPRPEAGDEGAAAQAAAAPGDAAGLDTGVAPLPGAPPAIAPETSPRPEAGAPLATAPLPEAEPRVAPEHSPRPEAGAPLASAADASPRPQTGAAPSAGAQAALTAALEPALAVPPPTPPEVPPPESPRPEPGPHRAGPLAEAGLVPRPRRRLPPSCTDDGTHCIAPVRFVRDVCRVIADVSDEAGIDPHFLTRLIWRESLFDPYAISPAGALGIAQFMPGTAKLRGLADPFNPAEAIRASALYLAEMARAYGNLGLAAAAYNSGEGRVAAYLSGSDWLPQETRAYVHAITGIPARTWRDAPPPTPPDLRLVPDTPFHEACVTRAASRSVPQFQPSNDLLPWAMIFAAHAERDVAEARARIMRDRHAQHLGEADVTVSLMRMPGRRLYVAQVGHASEGSASRQCNRLRRAGGGCMVLRN